MNWVEQKVKLEMLESSKAGDASNLKDTPLIDAVLMLGFGGPDSKEEVRPFVERVAKGRNITAERIEAVVEQYNAIGGCSPFNELMKRQAMALQALMAKQGINIPVLTGTLFSSPSIAEAVMAMSGQSLHRAVAIVMAPHRAEASFSRYVSSVNKAAEQAGNLQVRFVEQWHDHPLFIEAIADRVSSALKLLPDPMRETQIIFTAHSIPLEMPGCDVYAQQISESAALVAQALESRRWCVAYQSRSTTPLQSWLAPDVRDVIHEVYSYGVQQVALVPIGFVCDHVEVLYDLDVQAVALAKERGVEIVRAETVGEHPKFIELLGDLVKSAAQSI